MGQVGKFDFDEVNGETCESGTEVGAEHAELVLDPVKRELVLDDGEVAFIEGFDAFVDGLDGVADKEDQFAEAGVEIAFGGDFGCDGGEGSADSVVGVPEVGEWLTGRVDSRVQHAATLSK